MNHERFSRLVHVCQRTTPRRAVVALLAALPLGVAISGTPEAGARETRRSTTAEHNRKGSKRKRFCMNGKTVSAKTKRKKRRLRRQGATRGACPAGCNCGPEEICVNGGCHPCTVTCNDTPEACGASLATALLAGGEIYICPGHYAGTFTVSVPGTALFGAGSGEDTATNTVIDARQAGRVFQVENGIEGRFVQLRISGGDAPDFISSGGGIFMYNGKGLDAAAPLVVDACTFAGNASGGGGAIETDGQLTVTNSHFTANTSTEYGGAILLSSLDESRVNSITNCTFTGNVAEADGGAVWIRNQPLTISACTFTSNTAHDGAAIYAYGDVTPIEIDLDNQTLIEGNHATGDGSSAGGITAFDDATVKVNGATVKNNTPNNCSGVTGC